MAKKKKRKETKKKDTGYKVELNWIITYPNSYYRVYSKIQDQLGEFISDFSVFLVGTWYNLLLAALMVVGVYMMIKREKPDFFYIQTYRIIYFYNWNFSFLTC